jgi:hypothetical protein
MTLSDVCQEAKTIVILVVCLPWPLEHKSHPHMGTGRPPFEKPYGSSGVHTKEYGRSMYAYRHIPMLKTMPSFVNMHIVNSDSCRALATLHAHAQFCPVTGTLCTIAMAFNAPIETGTPDATLGV